MCRRVPIRVGQPRRRQRNRAIVPLRGQTIDDRSARVPKADQLGDLVVGLPGRVVSSRSGVGSSWLPNEIQARVATRHEDLREAGARRSEARATRCGPRDGERRRAAAALRAATAFANDTPTSSDPTSPGPWVTATAPNSVHVVCASPERTFDDATDVANVLA